MEFENDTRASAYKKLPNLVINGNTGCKSYGACRRSLTHYILHLTYDYISVFSSVRFWAVSILRYAIFALTFVIFRVYVDYILYERGIIFFPG